MTPSDTLVEVQSQTAVAPAAPPQLEIEPAATAGAGRGSRWPVLILAACVCAFAVVLTTFVLRPVVSQLTASSAEPWNSEGP
jgi:hypothetical protein